METRGEGDRDPAPAAPGRQAGRSGMRPRGRRAAPSPHTAATAPAPRCRAQRPVLFGAQAPAPGLPLPEKLSCAHTPGSAHPSPASHLPSRLPCAPRAGPTRSPVRSDVHSGDTGVRKRRTPLARGEEART